MSSGNAGAINAGKAVYKLGLDKKELDHGLAGAVKQVQALGASMAAAGAQIAALGAAMLAPLKKSVDVFSSFEKPMARVKALTAANTQQFDAMSNKAQQLGRDTMFMASDAANAMAFFALAGFKVDEILDAVGPTLDLAAVGMMDVAAAADIVAKVMRGMDQPTARTGYVVDVLAKAMTTANTDLIQLGEALKYVGPIATSAGWSLEETVAAIQTLSDSGVQSQMAGTTLRGMFLTMLRPTGRSAEEMEKLGVRVLDTSGKVRALADIISDFQAAIGNLAPGAQMSAIGRIFSKREAAGAAILIRRGGDALAARTAALDDTGRASKVAAIQINTVWGAFKILESSIEAVAIKVGQALMPSIRVVTSLAIDWVNVIGEWMAQNPVAVQAYAALAASILGVGAALATAGLAIMAVTSIGGTLASAVATGWALSWNHWVMGISKVSVLLSEIPAVHHKVVEIIEEVAKRIEKASHTLTETWSAMTDAIAGGDLASAVTIGVAGLTLAWLEASADIRATWIELTSFVNEKWTMATSPIMSFIHELIDGVVELSEHVMEALSQFDSLAEFGDAMGFGYRTSYRMNPPGKQPEESLDDYIKRRYPNAKPGGGGGGWAQNKDAFADNPDDPKWLRELNAQLREGRKQREQLLQEAKDAADKQRKEFEHLVEQQKQNKAFREAWPFLNAGIMAAIGGKAPGAPGGGSDDLLANAKKTLDAAGTFSTAVANQMGGKSIAERQLAAQEAGNKKLDGIKDAIGDIGLDLDFE